VTKDGHWKAVREVDHTIQVLVNIAGITPATTLIGNFLRIFWWKASLNFLGPLHISATNSIFGITIFCQASWASLTAPIRVNKLVKKEYQYRNTKEKVVREIRK